MATKIRNDILIKSLCIESLTSIFLASLLDIKDRKNSITLGNKRSSFSFDQKVNLLIDMGVLNKLNKEKFQTFMEIRNKFMHVLEITNYEKCFEELDGKEKWILRVYPQNTGLSKEKQLAQAVNDLAEDVTTLTTSISIKIDSKIKQEAEARVNEDTKEAILYAINNVRDKLDIVSGSEKIGTKLSKAIFSDYKKKMKELRV